MQRAYPGGISLGVLGLSVSTALRIPATAALSVTGAALPQLWRMKVTSWATSASDKRQPKPGIPRLEGATGVDGIAPPARIRRISELGSSARTVGLPAIAGKVAPSPLPSEW